MKKYDLVVFDMDGTLFDSADTIYKAAVKTFEVLGMKDVVFPREKFNNYIGAHFQDIFNDFRINVGDIEHYIEIYRDIYFDYIDDTKFYPGIPELLMDLQKSGTKLSLLTTKNQLQTERISDYFNLHKFFPFLMGRKPGIKIKPDPEPLEIIINHYGSTKEKTVMIGDSEFDIGCGRNAGVDTIAVGYGYRSQEFLMNENPTYYADTVEELKGLLVK